MQRLGSGSQDKAGGLQGGWGRIEEEWETELGLILSIPVNSFIQQIFTVAHSVPSPVVGSTGDIAVTETATELTV